MDQHADPAPRSFGSVGRPAPIGELIPPRIAPEGSDPALRDVLRAATQDVHDRLHRHAGFAAIQDATIGRAEYGRLIVRLYGFNLAFEAAASISPDRSQWLVHDLEALGLERPLHALPKCKHVPRLGSAHSRLGALYVAEGSALGGRDLARSLDRLLGEDVAEGRRFFIGRGLNTGSSRPRRWRL